MNKTISIIGNINCQTTIIDPNLPDSCKDLWSATGLLVQQAMKKAYLAMTVESIGDDKASPELSYLILSGKAPVVRNKRKQVGRDNELTKHDRALSLFGCLQHDISGRLKVGFISKPDESNSMRHSMKIVDANDADVELLKEIIKKWSDNFVLGESTEVGFGAISAEWSISKGSDCNFLIKINEKDGYKCVEMC